MSEKNPFHIVMEKSAKKSAGIFIGQMSSVPQNPLLKIIRIFAHLKHPNVMVCFKQKSIQILEIFDYIFIIFSKVSIPYFPGICKGSAALPGQSCRGKDTE